MTRHYPDLESASDWSCRVGNWIEPIRSTIQIWVVTRHQYGISALVSQTSFRRETSGGVAKCRLLSILKLKSTFIQSVLGVNRKYYGQGQNSESAISRLSVRLGRFCSELHYGAFGAKSLPFSCAEHWDKLRLPKQQKKGRTHYTFLIKIRLMD